MPLYIFGPGGPYTPMNECAHAFHETGGIEAVVTMGTPGQWIDRARESGDLIYGGAEYMMSDFIAAYPGIVDETTVTNLYTREVGIIVRKGNPAGISALTDLGRKGIRVLNVELEKMEALQNKAAGIRENISLSVLTGKEAFDAWPLETQIDAWITYRSWHVKLEDSSDFVRFPQDDKLFRATPVAITAFSKNRSRAETFIGFLKSDRARGIFQKWGWE